MEHLRIALVFYGIPRAMLAATNPSLRHDFIWGTRKGGQRFIAFFQYSSAMKKCGYLGIPAPGNGRQQTNASSHRELVSGGNELFPIEENSHCHSERAGRLKNLAKHTTISGYFTMFRMTA